MFSGCGAGEDSGSSDNDASNAGEVGFVPSPERPFENCTMVVSGTKGDGSKFSTCGGGPDEGLRYDWPVAQVPVRVVARQWEGALDIRYTNDRGGKSETSNWVEDSWSKTVTVNAGSYFSASATHKSLPMFDVVARGKISISLSANGQEFCFSEGTNFVSCDGTVPQGSGQSVTSPESAREESITESLDWYENEYGVANYSYVACVTDAAYELLVDAEWIDAHLGNPEISIDEIDEIQAGCIDLLSDSEVEKMAPEFSESVLAG